MVLRHKKGLPDNIMTTAFSQLWQCRFFRFLLVGLVNTAFSYLVYASMLFIGFNYAISNFIALMTGIFFSFRAQGHFVFRNSNNRLLGKFIIGWAGIYIVNVLLIRLGLGLGLNAYASGALSIPPVAVLAYLTQRFLVFRNVREGGT